MGIDVKVEIQFVYDIACMWGMRKVRFLKSSTGTMGPRDISQHLLVIFIDILD